MYGSADSSPGYPAPGRRLLAENPRTAKQATIKRASKKARAQMRKLDREQIASLKQAYRNAITDIQAYLQGRAGEDNTLRLEVMRDLLDQSESRLAQLAVERDGLLNAGLYQAADLGVQPFVDLGGSLTKVADDAVRHATSFIANDGLQLSDRVWNLNHQTTEAVTSQIQRSIIQGHSASQAAQDFLARGAGIPADVARKMNAAQWDKLYSGIKQSVLTGKGSAYANAKRLMRTEINRAHGEAYQSAAFDHEDVIGTRFLLSPNHPKADICDMHARVNRYGLGPGVYPQGKNPWPAHPNTLSFTEVVFDDEVTAEDKAGKTTRIDWLKTQTSTTQRDILGQGKRAALNKGLLKEQQINTPWRILKKRYEKQGIDISALKKSVPKPQKLKGTLITGIDPAELSLYADDSFKAAPDSVISVIEKTQKPDSIRVIPKGGSYFQGKGLVLAKSSMKKRPGFHSEYDVYRHEYGHFIDFWALRGDGKYRPPISHTLNNGGGLLNSMQTARKSLYAKSAAQKAHNSALRDELVNRYDTDLADLFGALTNNRIGWGHSKNYLKIPGNAETEVFANLFDIYSREDRSAWNLVAKELPGLAQDFIDLLERLA